MSTALEEPPVQQQPTQAPVTQSGDLRSMLESAAKGETNTDSAFKAETPEQSLSTETQKPVAQKPVQKPVKQATPVDKPKTKAHGLEAIKTAENAEEGQQEEVQGEVQTGDETLQEEPTSPQGKRWAELRKIEDTYKEIAPAYEKLKKDFEELKSKSGMTEEQKARFDHLEQMYSVELLDTKPEFQQEVIVPMQEQLNGLKSVADHAGLDATQRQALRAAAEEKDNFTRIRSIKQILSASTKIEDPEEIQTLVQFALEASSKYQEAKKKEDSYVSKAAELAHSVRGKEAQMSQQQKQAKQAEYDTAHKDMIGTLKAPLKALFDDPEFGPQLNESLESIRPAEAPMDQAYQAQAGEILPFAVKLINKLMVERDTARKSLKAREAARPRTTDGTTPVAEQGGQQQGDLKTLLTTMAR